MAAGMGLVPSDATGARWRVCWCPSAPGSRGLFWARFGVLFGGGARRGSG